MALRGRILSRRNCYSVVFHLALTAGLLVSAVAAGAQQTWHVQVRAESDGQAKQADAFLPNEIWIYAGDSIKFTFSPRNEVHSVTLLEAGQARPLFSGPPTSPATVKFPTAGNFKLVCLVRAEMNGVVHVMQQHGFHGGILRGIFTLRSVRL